MPEQPHAKIVVEKGRIKMVDVHTGREMPTGLKPKTEEEKDKAVRHIKEQLEKNGSRVSYREV